MSKGRPTFGTDGSPLPILPPERDARVWARLVRIMFYLPGFMALLLIKAGEPVSFGITVELLMLSSSAALVGGLFIGTDSSGAGSDASSKIGVWSGSLVLELLSVVPFLCAIPSLFHELAHSALLHARLPGTVDVALGASELLPMTAIRELDSECRYYWFDYRQLRRQSRGRLRLGTEMRRDIGGADGVDYVLWHHETEADAGSL